MKTNHLIKTILILAFVFIAPFSFTQMTGPVDPGGEPVGKPPVGGGAPVGGGIIFLLAFSTLYGGKKAYHLVKDSNQ